MKRANRLMLGVGVALAVASFVAVLALGSFGNRAAVKSDPDVTVVVAAVDLPLGALVTATQLATVTKPQSQAANSYQDPKQLVGQVVRHAVAKDAVLTADDFQTGVNVADVVGSLQAGMRAIAVPLSKTNSVGAVVQPGDRVDVLLTMEDLDQLNPVVMPNPNGSPGVSGGQTDPYVSLDGYVNNTTVKVVVQNVQVLAAIGAQPIEGGQSNNSSATPQPDLTVLLGVTPQQAEVIRFAQMDGNVSLVLRAPTDANAAAVDTTGITLKQLVDQYGVLPPAPVTPTNP
ncbi:MAG TPA: Flp pilus assembly protein CpaB [Candidatus Limnocylindrales bacterium]